MDWASLAGLILVVVGIGAGQLMEGGRLSSLVQPAAFVIVVLGTLGAVLLQSRLATFRQGVRMFRWVLSEPPDNSRKNVQDALIWSVVARREGFLSLERYMTASSDPFISKGLRLVIDGVDPVRLKDILEVDISLYEMEQRQAAKIWESAGGYSPTIGILGAVLGLIHVMENLSDPSRLGGGIAVAFVATIYGVGLANLLFLPVSNKLKEIIAKEITRREMLCDIFYSIALGDSPRVVEERVAYYRR
ncbi:MULTISPECIES: flagellar motor protein [unclassified Undibacterium]|uniref:flagellar motor protein n=1 Tax=unclassified Undibacterium TaxID=2630295 RepID=UPI002AC8A1F8|nr:MULTISPECIES: flagellar motor protein [unclassified Undibacterium]MEB0138793.1 flagellar motor protein [Undibacterium sp. CCC2.1]MEB0170731.1 flagellar motor protein [Undibacterium sp. CCC1.1]MEB0174620.1 flagellar motor protein [Undibacterium sp. CCC3.4]MEB0213817.1 flagellar motor protein [Undibacterium sp. 5I2]WPX42544.1 flagellar motor protein [Undibacterium sp. CCC3.4]